MPKLNDQQATKAAEGGEDFEAVDPGVYMCVLKEVNEKEGPAGPYWEWIFVIHSDADGNELATKPQLWENTSLSEKAVWRVGKMMEAFGVDLTADTDDLIGDWVGINVGQEISQQGARKGELRNTFVSAFQLSEDD